MWIYLFLIIVTFIGIAVGHYPGLRMNRATISLVGAALLIISGAISIEDAYKSIDMNTLVLLLSVMIINANLSFSGFFRLLCSAVIRFARTPLQLLGLIILFSGLLSALFLNDTIALMFTPLVLEITLNLKRNPVPYLIGLVTAANIGSCATITGNPQNMIIGISSKIPFSMFTSYLFPVALLGLIVVWLVIVIVYRREFNSEVFQIDSQFKVRTYKPLLKKSILASSLMLAAFVAGFSIPVAALGAAAFLLITRRLKPERVFREIDWSILVFFSGLFVVTGAIESTGLTGSLFSIAEPLAKGGVFPLTAVSVILSNLVSNVPAVLLFRPIIPHFHEPNKMWLTLAMSSTLAGNLTLLGSVANLIVAESARKKGVNISFFEYLKAGIPITLFSLIIGVLYFTFIR